MAEGGSFRVVSEGRKIENGLFWGGLRAHEPVSMDAWLEAAEEAGVVLDIGANSGVYALAAAAAGAGEVHAFEPVARVHSILKSNFDLNPGFPVHAWHLAVSNASGTALLHDPGGEAPTSASLSEEFAREHFGDVPAAEVSVITIDEFCALHDLGRVDLIKLDVEGFEEQALRGMQGTVLRDRPLILMEVLDGYEQRLRAVVVELFGSECTWTRVDEGDGSPNRNVLLDFRGKPVGHHHENA